MNNLNTVFHYRIPAQKVLSFKWWNYFKDALIKIYSYTYFLRKFRNNQERSMISYAKFILFRKIPEVTQWFLWFSETSIGMEKKILVNSELFSKVPEPSMTMHF